MLPIRASCLLSSIPFFFNVTLCQTTKESDTPLIVSLFITPSYTAARGVQEQWWGGYSPCSLLAHVKLELPLLKSTVIATLSKQSCSNPSTAGIWLITGKLLTKGFEMAKLLLEKHEIYTALNSRIIAVRYKCKPSFYLLINTTCFPLRSQPAF